MARFKESTVQEYALNYLKDHYRKGEKVDCIYAEKELRTKKEKGNKRADGLLCFQKGSEPYYTVSFEAKSHKTIGNLLTHSDDPKLGIHGILTASVITLLLGFFLGMFSDLPWYLVLLSSIIFFFFSAFVIIKILIWMEWDLHKFSGVVDQLKQYPANEQWIVYSKYTGNILESLPSSFRKDHLLGLKSLCKANGFGLMLVGKKQMDVLVVPKPRTGNFLGHYCREEKIITFLKYSSNPVVGFGE